MPASLGRHKLLGKWHYDALIADVVAGDLIFGNATPKWERLPKGTDGQYLKLISGFPTWAAPPAAPDHNLLSTIHPDTLPDAVVAGDLICGNSTPRWARLAAGLNGRVLTMVAGLPAWADPPAAAPHNLLSTIHADTLPAAVVRGDLIVGNATPNWARLPVGASARYLRSDGIDPAWAVIDHAELANVLPNQHHAQLHKDSHKTGGGDAFVLADLLDCVSRVKVRKNTGAVDVGARRRLNLIEGTNITLTVADDAVDEEVDVTIDAAAGAGAPALIDNQSATADLTAVTGAWTDLLTITRTTTDTRKVQVLVGYTWLAGTSATINRIRIVVNDVAVDASVRMHYVGSGANADLSTFHLLELAAGSHEIKAQYYASAASTIKERMLTALWVV